MRKFVFLSLLCVSLSACLIIPVTSEEKIMQPKPSRFSSVKSQCETHLANASKLFDDILAVLDDRNEANTLVPFNEIHVELSAASALSGLLSEVHPSKEIRDEAEACEQDLERFSSELSLNHPLYEALASINPESLDIAARRMLDKSLRDFRHSGVDKDDETRAKIQSTEQELVLIGQAFGRHIRDDVRYIEVKDLKGLPEDYVASHPADKNGLIKITTDYPDYIPFMTYADDAAARESIWRKFNARGYPANKPVLLQLIQKRHELAKLLGYKSYADYVIEDEMIGTAPHAASFINKIARISKKSANKEYALLLGEKRLVNPKAKKVFGYERAYLDEKYKQRRYHFDSQEVRPYFQFAQVRDGLLSLTQDLFGLRYEPVKDADVWHEAVSVYDVYDGTQRRGRIYLDLHPRENKFKHAAQFSLQSGLENRQIPEGVLVCNFGTDLMDHDQVVTFFHEFGHLLHHVMAGQQKWIRFSGVSTEHDFVEAPSQLFEEWAWDPQVLARFAKHEKTAKPISADLVSRMRAADEFGKGIDASQQMFYAAMSLQYYQKNPSSFEPLDLLKTLQAKYSQFPYVEGTHFNLNFGHLDDYSAMYYTYMWSKVIAKDLLTPFKAGGMLNAEAAQRYRRTILEQGGSKDANELVQDFLGRPYRFDAFQEWLECSTS